VRSVPSPTSFTATQAGADASNDAGTIMTKEIGGAITRGTFYDSTAFPGEYRGNLFFGDFNSGNLVRAVLSNANEVERVDVWGSGYPVNVQVTTGDDGALYALAQSTGALRRVSHLATSSALVVSNTNPYVLEGGRAAFTVALAAAPASNLAVTVARSSGDGDIEIASGASLIFTPANWRTPRAVVLSAAHDADAAVDSTEFTVSAPGLQSERVLATTIEAAGPDLVLSAEPTRIVEGEEVTFSVAWSARLDRTTTVTIARILGDSDVNLVTPDTLTFTPANWNTPQDVTIAVARDADDVGGSAQISIASPMRARILDLDVIDDDAPATEHDAGLADGGTEDIDGSTPDEDPSDAATVDAAPGADERDASEPDTDEPDAGEPDTDQPTLDASVDPDGDPFRNAQGGCQVNARVGRGPFWLALGLLAIYRRRRRAVR
jgi:hypothetical protein